jgi:hypothetical protein
MNSPALSMQKAEPLPSPLGLVTSTSAVALLPRSTTSVFACDWACVGRASNNMVRRTRRDALCMGDSVSSSGSGLSSGIQKECHQDIMFDLSP